MASLFVARGHDQGQTFVLESSDAPVNLGRDSECKIRLADSETSRRHAKFVLEGRHWWIEDLRSSNGTLVNGSPIKRQRLTSGDRIEIGSSLLIYTATQLRTAEVDVIVRAELEDAGRIVSSIAGTPLTATWTGPTPMVPGSSGLSGDEISSRRFAPPGQIDPGSSSRGSVPLPLTDGHPKSGTIDADRSLEVMYRTAIAVGRTDDLDELLQRVLRIVFDWVEADRGCVMLKDPESQTLSPAVRCDRDGASETARSGPMSISRTILDYVITRGEGVRTSDAKDDARFDSAVSIVQGGVREALCVPLQGRYDIVGALYVDTYSSPGQIVASGNRRRFNDDHLRLITAIGHQAALAIEDTTYYSALLQNERLAAMGQTIATLSHHIKNILQGIRGGSFLIESGLDRNDTDAVRRGWTIVDRNQERISHLVMDMLTFSKERKPEKVIASLDDTVQEVCDLMQTRAQELGIDFGFFHDKVIPSAFFDPEAIHRAVMNLVGNALDAVSAVKDTAKVFVRTLFDPQEGWFIEVIDNGPGVAPEDREKIFSLFESKKGMRGTGLGLPVCDKIMREHGGRVEIDDPPMGSQGSVFRLVLPIETFPQDAGPDDDQLDAKKTMA
jgi:two-component system, NtrC family, sensor kinase